MLTDLSITGRPAQFGGGVISDVSDKLLDLFVNCISARFTDGEFAHRSGAGSTASRPSRSRWSGWRTRPTGPRSAPSPTGSAPATPRLPARTADRPVRLLAAARRPTQPHVQVLGALLPVILKRYWPVLVGGALGVADREPDHPEPSRTVSAPRVGVVVTVCVALHRDGRWLLTVRGQQADHAPNSIGLVGGHLESRP